MRFLFFLGAPKDSPDRLLAEERLKTRELEQDVRSLRIKREEQDRKIRDLEDRCSKYRLAVDRIVELEKALEGRA